MLDFPWFCGSLSYKMKKNHIENSCWYGSPTLHCKSNIGIGNADSREKREQQEPTSFNRADTTTGKCLVWGLAFFGRVGKTVGTLGMWGSTCCPPLPRHQQHNGSWALRGCRAAGPAVPSATSRLDGEWPKEEQMLNLVQQAAAAVPLASHKQHRQLLAHVCMLPRGSSPSHAQQCWMAGICRSIWNLLHLFNFILRINPPASAGLYKSWAWLGIWGNLACRSNSDWLLYEQFAASCWLKIGWEIVNNV